MKVVLIITAIAITFGFSIKQTTEWTIPEVANTLVNPLKDNVGATEEGKKLFMLNCAVCHGEKGKGDGIGGLALTPKPRNFTLDKTQQQTDGALFWKMSEGRLPMASYKTILSSVQRWELVNFIRTFKK